MKQVFDPAVGDTFLCIPPEPVVASRSARLEQVLDTLRNALQMLDDIEAFLPAARLQQVIDHVVAEIASPTE